MSNKPITEEQVDRLIESLPPMYDKDFRQSFKNCIKQAKNQVLKEVLELKLMKDEEMPIHSGIYGDSNIKPDVRNKLRQQLRASIKELMEVK